MKLTSHFIANQVELVDSAAAGAVVAIEKAWSSRRDAQVVITGGRTGLAFVQALDPLLAAAHEKYAHLKVHMWFSDERFVELDSPDRTDTTLINGFTQSQEFIVFHRVQTPTQANLASATNSLQAELAATLQEEFAGKISPLNFDLVILSMGEDGHVASCFPGDTSLLNSTEFAAAISNSPKPPAERVTITLHRLGKSEITFIFALGEGKKEALAATLAGSAVMPIELLRQNSPIGEIIILTDIDSPGTI